MSKSYINEVVLRDGAVKLYQRQNAKRGFWHYRIIEHNLEHSQELKIVRRRKQLAVQRHLRIADQYIRNVMQGYFPFRSNR